MAQSVELLLDPAAEAAIRGEWTRLAAAGLPSEDRSARPDPASRTFHAPHVTLYAGDSIAPAAGAGLVDVVTGLDLEVEIGSVLVFGPRRGRCILVRSVVATAELLAVQTAVASRCDADPEGQFGPGRWSPHVTLARRVATDQVGACLELLGERNLSARITRCRRWDGTAKTAWLLPA